MGGIAWLDVLCSTYKYAYSNIYASYSNVPTYSWTVEVMTLRWVTILVQITRIGADGPEALDNCYTRRNCAKVQPQQMVERL